MKEVLYEFLIEPFKEGIGGIFVALTAWFTLIFTTLVIVYLSLLAGNYLNHAFQPQKQGYGIITDKKFVPEYVFFTITPVGKTFISTPVFMPDTYTFKISIDQSEDSKLVDKNVFDSYVIKDTVNILYKKALIGNTIYINEVINN